MLPVVRDAEPLTSKCYCFLPQVLTVPSFLIRGRGIIEQISFRKTTYANAYCSRNRIRQQSIKRFDA